VLTGTEQERTHKPKTTNFAGRKQQEKTAIGENQKQKDYPGFRTKKQDYT